MILSRVTHLCHKEALVHGFLPMLIMVHSFKEHTFTHFTYCGHCRRFLWGVANQGLKCSECEFVCHFSCQKSAPPCTSVQNKAARVLRSYSTSTGSSSTPTSSSSKSGSRSPIITALSRSPTNGSRAKSPTNGSREISPTLAPQAEETQPIESFGEAVEKIKSIVTSPEFEDVLVTAALHASDDSQPSNEYLATLPSLNPQTATKNSTRFVSRCGPMFAVRDSIILLLSWENPLQTMVAMVLYCIACFYPKIILFGPHFALMHWMTNAHQKRFRSSSLSPPLPSPPVARSTVAAPTPTASHSVPLRTASPAGKRTGSFTFNIGGSSNNYEESSPEYLKNLQNLQNMMGEMSDLYDTVCENLHYINWGSRQYSIWIFQGLVLSMILLSILISFVSMRDIMLGGGIFMFVSNTRFVKHVMKQITPKAMAIGKKSFESIMDLYDEYERVLDRQTIIQEISVYENQRRGPSGEFSADELLPLERGSWTDSTGIIPREAKKEEAPEGYCWTENAWEVDTSGSWTDDMLGIEMLVIPEDDGWVYTDDLWRPCKADILKYRVTRRRRWIRHYEENRKRGR
ncbi:hypothetical protein PHYBLDRAFT_58736 [Phycomyces blakesleeanus NRRL 1555(-)]|uniref:Phorbol-ester/DAG-type domain-containing protein n=2 Tax=Phycomyces blakesleeanus TaxID=4837 RepID=A0A167QH65_PHYB8|nr:hypothetical protein PHYBLDRAFT_58736 [Phycomyces blakesleeanus NRRL 1555(-)]OAD79689.1 hypothetical protein PHYBLDRAFT_58736 [Phycomyces blakesleeanus NRRL 1555(-)]|eukprot:XP_018297729.1 hypothetical protein PHYBLDRAFT_58736 [Phycomyces blakesleeanus NRRL 1555(-)]